MRAAHYLRSGVRLFDRGRYDEAATRIEIAIRIGGPSFEAHLYLGRIHLRRDRFDRARQEFAQARFLDPGRFRAEGLPEDLLLAVAERFDPFGFGPLERGLRDRRPVRRSKPLHNDLALPRRDDFSSRAEREHFRDLPPIDEEDISAVDWDALAERLLS